MTWFKAENSQKNTPSHRERKSEENTCPMAVEKREMPLPSGKKMFSLAGES